MEKNILSAGWIFESPIGPLFIEEQDGAIVRIRLPGSPAPEDVPLVETRGIRHAIQQMQEYFAGTRKEFDLPLNPSGTPFMRRVWDALLEIPYGGTASYKDIAEKVGSPKGYRAVGLANNRNPIPIVVPCHRVIGTGGAMVGYAGGLPMKEALLAMERKYSR